MITKHVKPLIFSLLMAICGSFNMVQAQKKAATVLKTNTAVVGENQLKRPKLVVGLVVDQMRWDYFYRYYDRYSNGGFKRILNEGFKCENTQIPYAQTVTAAGHACIYTGSVPAINGIMGNDWYDKSLGRNVYCVEDSLVKIVGGNQKSEPMSPKNLFTTTISDEMRIATNFRSKTIGVSIKDRGSILPAGHTGTAYWYDKGVGKFVTSTHYMDMLPNWVDKFNDRKLPDSFYSLNWNTLYPIETYTQSTKDLVAYEGRFTHEKTPTFPHELASQMGTNYGTLSSTPYGNTYVLQFAIDALRNEQLGKDNFTDMLAVSVSSTDYLGHQFGPNSIELEDTYLRLDKDLEKFFAVLDKEVGKDNYIFFISADHGAAHVPQFLQSNKIHAKTVGNDNKAINAKAKDKYGIEKLITASGNYHLYFDHEAIAKSKASHDEITKFVIKELMDNPVVLTAIDAHNISTSELPSYLKEKFLLGYNNKLGGDVIVILKPGYFPGGSTGTTHGSWYPYDSHIPLVFMGAGIKPGSTHRETHMSDIAATLAAFLRIQMPSGNIGQPITEMLDNN